MSMKNNIQDCFPVIDESLNDEFDLLAGCNPIWILNWLTSDKYLTSLKPRKRIIVYPNTKEQFLNWVKSDAASSNCVSLLPYIDGTANEQQMLKYAQELIRNIEYEQDPEELKERLRAARWNLNEVQLIIQEL